MSSTNAFRLERDYASKKKKYLSAVKKNDLPHEGALYFESRFLYSESSIHRRVHMHVSRRVNRGARFFCTLRGPAFSGGPSDIDGFELTRLYSIFVPTVRDGCVPVNSTISRVKSAPVSGESESNTCTSTPWAVSRFPTLRFTK